jgi:hypothetical protein
MTTGTPALLSLNEITPATAEAARWSASVSGSTIGKDTKIGEVGVQLVTDPSGTVAIFGLNVTGFDSVGSLEDRRQLSDAMVEHLQQWVSARRQTDRIGSVRVETDSVAAREGLARAGWGVSDPMSFGIDVVAALRKAYERAINQKWPDIRAAREPEVEAAVQRLRTDFERRVGRVLLGMLANDPTAATEGRPPGDAAVEFLLAAEGNADSGAIRLARRRLADLTPAAVLRCGLVSTFVSPPELRLDHQLDVGATVLARVRWAPEWRFQDV